MKEQDIIMDAIDETIREYYDKKDKTKKDGKVYFCHVLTKILQSMTGEQLEKFVKEMYGDMNDATIHLVFYSKFLEERKEVWKSKNKKYIMF